jgi:hypothetical protein
MSNNILNFFKKAYPFIATALQLGGPAGNLAAQGLGAVLEIDEPTPATISKALEGATLTPELLAQIKIQEDQLAATMKQLGIQSAEEMTQMYLADRADARQMAIKTGDKWTPRMLSAVITMGFFGTLYYVIKVGLPSNAAGHDAVLMLLGSLTTAFAAVCAFYLGSSAGSDRKNDLAELQARAGEQA